MKRGAHTAAAAFAVFGALTLGGGVPATAVETSLTVPAATTGECTAATRISAAPPALDTLQPDLAWALTRGEGVTVAVVDSGVQASNPHLTPVVSGGIDLVGDGLGSGGQTDLYGHGTVIAGQIAAQQIDGSGLIGLAPEARILPVRVYADTEEDTIELGFGPTVAKVTDGIRAAADAGAQVISVSLSTAFPNAALDDAVAYAASRGSLVISSSGNRDQSQSIGGEDTQDGTRYPAGSDGAIGVAATDSTGVVTDASIHGAHVALSAPGQNILSTSQLGGDCIYSPDTPATSYATGYVAAAAALVASAHPDETPAQWAYRLEATALRANPDARDDISGWGLVQPYDAIILTPGSGIRGPVSPFPESGPAPVPAPAATTIQVEHQDPLDAEAVWAAVRVGVVGIVLIGVIATIGILRRRRRDAHSEPVDLPRGPGLYRDDDRPDEF